MSQTVKKVKYFLNSGYQNKLGSQAIQNITERLDKVYKKFFKKQGGIPTFKKVKKYKLFTLKDNVISLNGYKYKFYKLRQIDRTQVIKTVTVKRDNIGYFYICISLILESPRFIYGDYVILQVIQLIGTHSCLY